MPLSDEDVAWVLAAKKRVTEKVRWRPRPARTATVMEVSFAVLVPARTPGDQGTLGRVDGSSSRWGTRIAFIYANICIARWESSGAHPNPDGTRLDGPHKHRWSAVHEDRVAYQPNDISEIDQNSILLSFLTECRIDLEGGYESQGTLGA
ncbi:MAG: hypothetical protein WEB13_12280 [Dehalococcoidia bacterium]